MRSAIPFAALLLLVALGGCASSAAHDPAKADSLRIWGPVRSCFCDHARPESLAERNCSLCRVAESREGSTVLVKDIDPEKPNRWLAMPRRHVGVGHQSMADLTDDERHELANFAVREGERLFPGRWAVAVNPTGERSQCHLHLHVGRRRGDALCTNSGILVTDPSRILDAVAVDGSLWAHPDPDGGYHVHTAVAVEGMLER